MGSCLENSSHSLKEQVSFISSQVFEHVQGHMHSFAVAITMNYKISNHESNSQEGASGAREMTQGVKSTCHVNLTP